MRPTTFWLDLPPVLDKIGQYSACFTIAPAQSRFAERLRIRLRGVLNDQIRVAELPITAVTQQSDFATFGRLGVQPAPRFD